MIDGCWVKEGARPVAIVPTEIKSIIPVLVPDLGSCESVVRIGMTPTPELASIWSTQCWSEHAKKKRKYTPYMQLGRQQFLKAVAGYAPALAKKFATLGVEARMRQYALLLRNVPEWEAYVLKLPYAQSSQLWKGIQHYKIKETDYGYQQERIAAQPDAFWIGAPHGYRMLADASDHYALLAFVL